MNAVIFVQVWNCHKEKQSQFHVDDCEWETQAKLKLSNYFKFQSCFKFRVRSKSSTAQTGYAENSFNLFSVSRRTSLVMGMTELEFLWKTDESIWIWAKFRVTLFTFRRICMRNLQRACEPRSTIDIIVQLVVHAFVRRIRILLRNGAIQMLSNNEFLFCKMMSLLIAFFSLQSGWRTKCTDKLTILFVV